MVSCASCSGRGTWTCTSCHGRRYTSRLTVSGDMDMSPCAVCGASGRVRCQFCHGTGQAPSPIGGTQTRPPPSRPRGALEDPLHGLWNGPDGSWMEFTRQGTGYQVIEGGPLGKSGQGTATLQGQTVKLNSTNIILGSYRLEFQIVGDQLQGTITIMGFPMPLILSRG